MIIFFGTKQRRVPVKDGARIITYCPQCECEQELREYRWRTYFTLYFIPLFPVNKGQTVMGCPVCGTDYLMKKREESPPAKDPRLDMDMWR